MDASDILRSKLAGRLVSQTASLTPGEDSYIKQNLNAYKIGSGKYLDGAVSYKGLPFDEDFRLGTGDFTIEWWQILIPNANYPRIFSIGNFGDGPGSLTVSIAVSQENNGIYRDIYYWRNSGGAYGGNNGYKFASVLKTQIENIWVHFALVRRSGVTRMYMNGTQLGSDLADTTNIGSLEPYPNAGTFTGYNILAIGDEIPENTTATTSFGGYLFCFRWVKGVAVYTGNFSVPNEPLKAVPGTKLLMYNLCPDGSDLDSSGLNKKITSVNVTPSSETPIPTNTVYGESSQCVNFSVAI